MFADKKYAKRGNHNKTVMENVIIPIVEKGKTLETFLWQYTKIKL